MHTDPRLPPRPPRRPVVRAEIVQRIRSTPPAGAFLLCAAPGYGATTAALSAVGTDPVAFLDLAHLPRKEAMAAVRAARDGLTAAGGPAWLVLDAVPDADVLSEEIAAVLARLPAHLRCIITSHHELGSILAAGRVHERLDEAELRWSDEEALGFLQHTVPGIDIDVAMHIVDDAEGWIAALCAAATANRSRPDPEWLRRTGADLLFSEWFSHLPQRTRMLLRQTAVLDLLSSGPVRACTGVDEAGRALADLSLAHRFVTEVPAPEGHTGRWWRRHGLLTTFLLDAGSDFAASHEAAAGWYRGEGDVTRTMHHLLAAGRRREAGQYLEDNQERLFRSGSADEVLRWSGQIVPSDVSGAEHLLRIAWGQVLSDDYEAAEGTAVRLAAQVAGSAPLDIGSGDLDTRAELAVLDAYLAGAAADPRRMVESSREAIDSPGRLTDGMHLAPVLLVRGLAWSGRLYDALDLINRVQPSQMRADLVREVNWKPTVAAAWVEAGRVREAQVLLESSRAWSQRHGVPGSTMREFTADLVEGGVLLEAGEADSAQERAASVRDAAERVRHHGFVVVACLLLARIRMVRGDLAGAADALDTAGHWARRRTPDSLLLGRIDEARALHQILGGDTVRAESTLRRMPAGLRQMLLWAQLQIRRRPVAVAEALRAARPLTPREAAQVQILLSQVHLGASRRRAGEHLRKAVGIADQYGVTTVFAHVPADLRDFAAQMALDEQDDTLGRVLATVTEDRRHAGTDSVRLTAREVQLLSLLPTRAGNAQLAEQLGVSVNTVKTQLRRLYAKLGARGRDDAVQRAVERGLIARPPLIR